MMKPLIKYTGGKYKEYLDIKQYFPDNINNYFEPFFGGGGVFFRLHNEKKISGQSYINDFSKSLVDFYESITSSQFESELNNILLSWEYIKSFGEDFYKEYGNKFKLCLLKKDIPFMTDDIKSYIYNKCHNCVLNMHNFSLYDKVCYSLLDKLHRFQKKNISNDDENVVYNCITTCICQSFYFIIRDMYNDWNNHNHFNLYTKEERSAQWMFIREFCFGSMHRFGRNGDYNVPYGGFSYNNKDFKSKINNVIQMDVYKLFSQTYITCGDFENAFKLWNFSENDFMFLDPPYDSIFTDYDNNSFDKSDHIRLANCLKTCECKWLMAIGSTDFIKDLYKEYEIIPYAKTYMYQARGEYDSKHTKHIIIRNFTNTINSLW